MNIYFDGSSKKNPGPGVSGWIIHTPKKHTLYGWIYHEHCTNNESEYKGLLFGLLDVLKYIKDESIPPSKLQICGDSLLVIKQIQGLWKVKKETLMPLKKKGWSVNARHVVRENNKLADFLTNYPFNDNVPRIMSSRTKGVITTVSELERVVLLG
jgi:ribonuclease HI